MTLRDEIPVHRCAVKACPMLGRWPEGGRCPEHRADIYAPRPPELHEQWDTDNTGRR